MRHLLVANMLILILGIGYAFRITEFLDPFFPPENNNHHLERQSSDVNDQIVPLFLVTFAASTIFNLLTMNLMGGVSLSPITDCDNYQWCYEGDCAASTWGTCVEACNGMKQSPIDIPAVVQMGPPSATKPLTFTNYQNVRFDFYGIDEEHYRINGVNINADGTNGIRAGGKLKNKGYTVQIDVDTDAALAAGAGVLTGGPLQAGTEYNILQLHFHWGANDARGSEHTYSGREFPIELHIVHTRKGIMDPLNTPTGLAVTGFMFEVDPTGTDNAALKPLTDALSRIVNSQDNIPFTSSDFNLNALISPISTTSEYTYYSGSLTTPTCNEVVEWINILTPLKISSSQLAEFRKLMNPEGKPIVDNYRPPQPLNSRTVLKYRQ